MNTFVLHLQSATQNERIEKVESFVGRDASGSFGILAGHAPFMTSLVFGMARIGMAEPLDEALAKHQKSMRIFLRDERPITSVYERLKARGEGEVSLVLILDDGDREVEVKLPGKYMATPQIAGALRAVPGVVDVHVN